MDSICVIHHLGFWKERFFCSLVWKWKNREGFPLGLNRKLHRILRFSFSDDFFRYSSNFAVFVSYYCNSFMGLCFFVSGFYPISQISGEKRNANGLEEKDELSSKRVKVQDLVSGKSSIFFLT